MLSVAPSGESKKGGGRAVRIGAACVSLLAVLAPAAAQATCPAAPVAACRNGGLAKLKMHDDADDARDRVLFSLSRGPAAALADLGDPAAASAVSLCIWDAAGPLVSFDLPVGGVCGGKPCWTRLSNGFRYRDSTSAVDGVRSVTLGAGAEGRSKFAVDARGLALPDRGRAAQFPLTVQLLRDDATICVEALFSAAQASATGAIDTKAKGVFDTTAAVPALGSAGCGAALARYTRGTSTVDQLGHDGITRTFRVYVPPSYDDNMPAPLVLVLHGGFGSGQQVEASTRIVELANAQGFIAVSPDGVPDPTLGIRSWNGGGCCGYAMNSGVDDIGFVRALLDQIEVNACVDRRRVYATGMSNGAILSHRLACEAADRIRAIGPVAGTNMTPVCAPSRPVPVIHVHGSADLFVPPAGGLGCGPGGIPYTSLSDSLSGWAAADGCSATSFVRLVAGDGTCTRLGGCGSGADVDQCLVANGGHQWPGGTPPVLPGIGNCSFGYQSQTFSASSVVWDFFAAHPPR